MENNKNLWVIPTDKPSRLYLSNYGKELNLGGYPLRNYTTGQNIYITSDEEIKEGDWMIRNNEQPIKVTKDFFWDFGVRYYKIILTTDPRLAPDVQKISDEFLEWFVKNPSCEEVEVIYGLYNPMGRKVSNEKVSENHSQCVWKYKIIIPKEEPKQETLEEAAERLFKIYSSNTSLAEGHYDYMMDKEDFKEASLELSKWHQERSYSEEEVFKITQQLRIKLKSGVLKWQDDFEFDLEQWFSQFKKK